MRRHLALAALGRGEFALIIAKASEIARCKLVEVFGMPVRHGGLPHSDRPGTIVIPEDLLANPWEVIELMERREKSIRDPARVPGFDVAMPRQAFAESDQIK